MTTVHPVGYGFDPNYFSSSQQVTKRYWPITKLEIVCSDKDVDRLVEVIRSNSYTGLKGDGMIFVSPVGTAIRIRSGEKGEAAL